MNEVPGSTRRSTRSRASIFPRDVWRLREASPPPPATWLSFSRKSATSARMASALRPKSWDDGSMLEWSGMGSRVSGDVVRGRDSVAAIPIVSRDLSSFRHQLAADQHAADFRGAGPDLVELCVAPETSDRKLGCIADAAERLDRLARHPRRLLRRIEDRGGRVLAQAAGVVGAVAGLSDRVDIGTRGLP